jgi:hypothetical protein
MRNECMVSSESGRCKQGTPDDRLACADVDVDKMCRLAAGFMSPALTKQERIQYARAKAFEGLRVGEPDPLDEVIGANAERSDGTQPRDSDSNGRPASNSRYAVHIHNTTSTLEPTRAGSSHVHPFSGASDPAHTKRKECMINVQSGLCTRGTPDDRLACADVDDSMRCRLTADFMSPTLTKKERIEYANAKATEEGLRAGAPEPPDEIIGAEGSDGRQPHVKKQPSNDRRYAVRSHNATSNREIVGLARPPSDAPLKSISELQVGDRVLASADTSYEFYDHHDIFGVVTKRTPMQILVKMMIRYDLTTNFNHPRESYYVVHELMKFSFKQNGEYWARIGKQRVGYRITSLETTLRSDPDRIPFSVWQYVEDNPTLWDGEGSDATRLIASTQGAIL